MSREPSRELVREPGDWEGPPPAGQLIMRPVRRQPAGRPGWVTVSGWRWLDTEPGPAWVTVQVRAEPGTANGTAPEDGTDPYPRPFPA